MKNISELVGITIITLLRIVFSMCLSAFILMSFWEWFIMNIVHVEALSLVKALGLATTIRFLTWESIGRPVKRQLKENGEAYTTLELWATAVCTYGLVYLIGFIIHLFL